MEVRAAERRSTRRLQFKTALHVRVWKSGPTERRAESVNLSETGAFFATDAPIAIGSVIEILLKMAEAFKLPSLEPHLDSVSRATLTRPS